MENLTNKESDKKMENEEKEIHLKEEILHKEEEILHEEEEILHDKEELKELEKSHEQFHIFINGIKYTEKDGVKHDMTGRELAALVPVPADNAEITYKKTDKQIGLDEHIEVCNGEQFEVIRKKVVAGNGTK